MWMVDFVKDCLLSLKSKKRWVVSLFVSLLFHLLFVFLFIVAQMCFVIFVMPIGIIFCKRKLISSFYSHFSKPFFLGGLFTFTTFISGISFMWKRGLITMWICFFILVCSVLFSVFVDFFWVQVPLNLLLVSLVWCNYSWHRWTVHYSNWVRFQSVYVWLYKKLKRFSWVSRSARLRRMSNDVFFFRSECAKAFFRPLFCVVFLGAGTLGDAAFHYHDIPAELLFPYPSEGLSGDCYTGGKEVDHLSKAITLFLDTMSQEGKFGGAISPETDMLYMSLNASHLEFAICGFSDKLYLVLPVEGGLKALEVSPQVHCDVFAHLHNVRSTQSIEIIPKVITVPVFDESGSCVSDRVTFFSLGSISKVDIDFSTTDLHVEMGYSSASDSSSVSSSESDSS